MQYICWINHLPGARARYAPQRLLWPEWSWQQVRKNFSSSSSWLRIWDPQFQAHYSQPPLATALPGLVSSKSWKHRLLRPLSWSTISPGRSLYLRVSFLTGKQALFYWLCSLSWSELQSGVSSLTVLTWSWNSAPSLLSPGESCFLFSLFSFLQMINCWFEQFTLVGRQASVAKRWPGSWYGVGSKCRHVGGGESS